MEVFLHKEAQKSLARADKKIKKRFLKLYECIISNNLYECNFEVQKMKGKYGIYKEVKIDKDYRVVLREGGQVCYIRHAGTHNYLKTG